MAIQYDVVSGKDTFVIEAQGTLDLASSLQALEEVALRVEPDGDRGVLLDLREVACDLAVADVYELAQKLAWPDSALPRTRRVAVVVSAQPEFDNASFLALCARNRGMAIQAFTDVSEADAWLRSERGDPDR